MQEKSLLELYQLFIEYWKSDRARFVEEGICAVMYYMHKGNIKDDKYRLTFDQYELLRKDFESRKPIDGYIKSAKWTDHPSWVGTGYWWKRDEFGYHQRTMFIKFRITQLQNILNSRCQKDMK